MVDSVISHWLQGAGRYPLLTANQEITLGKAIATWLQSEDPTRLEIKRGQRAKKRLIQSNLRLVANVAKKFLPRIKQNSNINHEDILQEGILGLNRAAEKFDFSKGYKFSTYAYWWIRQAMQRYIETQSNSIRTSNTALKLSMKWRYRPEGQTLEEFSEVMGLSAEYVKSYLDLCKNAQTHSLDAKLKDANDESCDWNNVIHAPVIDEHDAEYIAILEELKGIDEIKEAINALELKQTASITDVAHFLGCGPGKVKSRLKDLNSHVREHMPADLRARLMLDHKKAKDKIEKASSVNHQSPEKEFSEILSASTLATAVEKTSAPLAIVNGPVRVLEKAATAVVAPPVPLSRNEDAVAQAEPESEAKGHSRQPRGECGRRIGERIDAIVQLIRGPVITPEDEWPDDEPLGLEDLILEIQTAPDDLLHSSVEQVTEALPVEIPPASEDPPAPASRGEAERAPDAIAVGGNGFTHQQSTVCASPPPITAADATATVWDAFAGRPDCANDITDFLQQLDTEPRLRSAAMLRTLGRVREELEAMPEQSALDARVCVSLQDALVLMSQVMSRIR